MKKMFLLAACTALLAGGVAVASQTTDEDTSFTVMTDPPQSNVPRNEALEICPGQLEAGCAVGEQTGEQLKYPD